MFQDILTYTAIILAFGFTAYQFFLFIFPKKEKKGSPFCGSCCGCEVRGKSENPYIAAPRNTCDTKNVRFYRIRNQRLKNPGISNPF